jgi:hypothetical protein
MLPKIQSEAPRDNLCRFPSPRPLLNLKIFEFAKEFDPASAYLNGIGEYVGRLFIPSKRNLERFSHRVEELRLKAENRSQLKLLDSLSAANTLAEPQSIAESILSAFFGYLIQEGIIPSHLRNFTRNAVRAIQAATAEYADKSFPTGIRVLTLISCVGLQEILRTIKKETRDKPLRTEVDGLVQVTRKYASIFKVKGFKGQAFDKLYFLIKKDGWHLGRERIYSQAISRLYDYPETPELIEAKGVKYLDRELPGFQRLTKRLAQKYGTSAKAEESVEGYQGKKGP